MFFEMKSVNSRWFKKNFDLLYSLYPEKWLIIYNKIVVAHADNPIVALEMAIEKKLKFGTFLIQCCTKDESCLINSTQYVSFRY